MLRCDWHYKQRCIFDLLNRCFWLFCKIWVSNTDYIVYYFTDSITIFICICGSMISSAILLRTLFTFSSVSVRVFLSFFVPLLDTKFFFGHDFKLPHPDQHNNLALLSTSLDSWHIQMPRSSISLFVFLVWVEGTLPHWFDFN